MFGDVSEERNASVFSVRVPGAVERGSALL